MWWLMRIWPEAIRRLEVEDLPVIVVNDVKGNDLYIEGERKYRKTGIME